MRWLIGCVMALAFTSSALANGPLSSADARRAIAQDTRHLMATDADFKTHRHVRLHVGHCERWDAGLVRCDLRIRATDPAMGPYRCDASDIAWRGSDGRVKVRTVAAECE